MSSSPTTATSSSTVASLSPSTATLTNSTRSPCKNKLNNLIQDASDEHASSRKRIKLSESVDNFNGVKSNNSNGHLQQHQEIDIDPQEENQVKNGNSVVPTITQAAALPPHSSTTNGTSHNSNSSQANNMPSSNGNSNGNNASDNNGFIDEGLYSRQLYVLGHEAMRRMQASNVLISGMGGLGVEIAKNIVLGGVKSLTIHDTTAVTQDDLATQFFLRESDLGKNRATCTQTLLAELNTYVPVLERTTALTTSDLAAYQVVVLTESSTQEQLEFGAYCHANNIKFIVAQTRGLFGQIFCDFGESFEVNDTTGEPPLSTMISAINNDAQGVVTTLDEQRHGFEDDTIVTFTEVVGMKEVNGREFKIKVLGPYTFSIGDASTFSKYIRGGYVHEVKKPRVINFKSITEAIKEPTSATLISDFNKMDDTNSIHLAFHTVHEYVTRNGSLPRPWHVEDANKFVQLANELNTSTYHFEAETVKENILRIFASTASGALSPINAVIGGTAAQEVMKACSGKFTPIVQYFYFDCREALPENPFEVLKYENCTVESTDTNLIRYKSQIAVFGREFQQKLGRSKYFLVGAGALGCEYLKNFAMMGLGTKSQNGFVIVTDMDTIEKSNLNRQFLFRSHDVQKPKATVAGEAAMNMNPDLHIIAHTNRVGPDTEHVYDDPFFEQLDGVCNALDNIDARVYMDRRCVYYQKPLIESGTLGTKGNVQVVLPFLTESYSSTQDPPEKSIPFCTLRNFPNAIEHTLEWARDMFQGVFTSPAMAANEYLKDPKNYIQRVLKLKDAQPFEELQRVYKALVDERPTTFEDCVRWARLHFQENYHDNIEQLLYNFPPDQLTNSGVPFWSGPKRCPHSLKFTIDTPTYLDYVYSAANLKAEMYGLKQVRDRQLVAELSQRIQVAPFKPKQGVKIHTSDAEAQNAMSSMQVEAQELDNVIEKLNALPNLKDIVINPIEFEKDDDTNLHMDFIVACSNLRAENYDIAPADKHKSKLIAGRIIPAIATTTSLVVGLDCIELYKLIQGHKKIELYKSSFVNLALPYFGLSEPLPPKKFKYYENEFTLWNRFEVNGEITLKEFFDHFEQTHKLKISMISQGVVMLYSFFIDAQKKKERLAMPISQLVEAVGKKPIPAHVRTLVLELMCSDMDDNDVEVPYVKYILPRNQ